MFEGIVFVGSWWQAVELVGEDECGGQREALSTASESVRRRRIVHKSTASLAAARQLDRYRGRLAIPLLSNERLAASSRQPERLLVHGVACLPVARMFCKDGYE
jgi:hypothetical protein